MEKNKNNLVFLAKGEMYNKQCLFAILSLLNVYDGRFPASIQVNIYTDDPGYFTLLEDKISLNLIPIDQETIVKWLNGHNFFLITKILVIRDFLQNYSGNMVFVDTDVIFKKRLDSTFFNISIGNHVLHLREGKLSLNCNIHFLEAFKGQKFQLSSGRTITIGEKSEMWNSGLIGLSSRHLYLVDDVLELCHKMIPYSSSRFLEQLAFSLVLQDTGKLIGDHLKLVHYWWKKKLFNTVIVKVLDEEYPNLNRLLIMADKLDPTNRTLQLRLFYSLHPNGFLRKSMVKTSLILNFPIN